MTDHIVPTRYHRFSFLSSARLTGTGVALESYRSRGRLHGILRCCSGVRGRHASKDAYQHEDLGIKLVPPTASVR